MRSIGATNWVSTPASSRTSRSAAASRVSPASIRPFGSCQRAGSPTEISATSTPAAPPRNATPLRGVKVSARSDTQIGGTKVAYTNEEGYFRLPALQPGEFEIRATAPKMQTVVQKDVKVGISVPSEVNLIMEVEAAVEEV